MIIVRKNGEEIQTLQDGDVLHYNGTSFGRVVVTRKGTSRVVLDEKAVYEVSVMYYGATYNWNEESFDNKGFYMSSIDFAVDYPSISSSGSTVDIEIQLFDFTINDEFNRYLASYGSDKVKNVYATITGITGARLVTSNSVNVYEYNQYTGATANMTGWTLEIPEESSMDVSFDISLDFYA